MTIPLEESPSLFPGKCAFVAPEEGGLERLVAEWERLARRAHRERRADGDLRRLRDLGRDLRALRDCHSISRHPRVRAALEREGDHLARRLAAWNRSVGRKRHRDD